MSKSNLPIEGTLNLRYPIFEGQIEPKGRLLIHRGCHACWWYAILTTKNLDIVGVGLEEQVIVVEDGLPTPLWHKLNFDQIARSIALLYQLDSPEEFLKFRHPVEAEALRLGFALNPVIWKPFGVGLIQ